MTYQPVFVESLEGLVETAGRRVEPSSGACLDILPDCVPVTWCFAQGEQDVEREVAQREKAVGIFEVSRHIVPRHPRARGK